MACVPLRDRRTQVRMVLKIIKFTVMFLLLLGFPVHVLNWVSNFLVNKKWFDDKKGHRYRPQI